MTALFALGQVVATPGALDLLARAGANPVSFLVRHVTGDWGSIDPEDRGLNERAVRSGQRVFSVYHVGGETVWVITEADRSATTILLPADY